jgi:hypothetical protein
MMLLHLQDCAQPCFQADDATMTSDLLNAAKNGYYDEVRAS